MEQWQPETYGDAIADVYDEYHASLDPAGAVDFLASIAGNGPVLELGIGTGRVALPLVARGVTVRGIDASTRMIGQLRAKRGGDAIDVHVGNFASFDLDEQFSLVYVVFNTLFVLLTQDEQVRCFESVAAHLARGGRFVTECFVPDVGRFDGGSRIDATKIEIDEVRLDASMHDAATQTVRAQHIAIRGGAMQLVPITLRYAWPSELDLMARLTGFDLDGRYGGWNREPFDSRSTNHVSVYVRR